MSIFIQLKNVNNSKQAIYNFLRFSTILNFDQNVCQGLKIVHVNVEKLFTNVRIKSLLGPYFTLNLLFVEVMEFKCQ